jgi:hypothetical protein
MWWIGTTRGLHRYDHTVRAAARRAELKFTIYPNPAWLSSVGIGIKIDGNATSYFGEVYDLQGRRLRKFSGVGNQGVVWDGRTDQGDLVRPGMYFFRVESGGKSATSRVILLRAAVAARVLPGPPSAWEALVASDPCATAAHRAGLAAALAQTLPAMEPRFVAVERAGRLVGGAPLVIERRAGFHWIHALPFLLPGAPLAAFGEREAVDTAVAEALAGLQRELRAVGGEWSLYRVGDSPPAPAALEVVGGETRTAEAAVVELAGGHEAVRARMDRKTRQAIRGARAAGLEFAEEPAALTEGLRALPAPGPRLAWAPPAAGGALAPPARAARG